MNAFLIDTFEFCRLKEHRVGDIAVADLPRLSEDTADKSGAVHWSLQGGADRSGHPKLMLSISGVVKLKCQRCLTSFAFEIASESALVVVKDEESIDETEALLDDDEVDVIVGSKAFDIAELIEDEALLAIPLSPKHDVCPDQATLDAVKSAKKASPFAVLKNIK
jgi:uncharacterized protein